jgi:hypothetical protein
LSVVRYAVQICLAYSIVFTATAFVGAYAATVAGVIGAVERAWWVRAMIRGIPLGMSTWKYKLPTGVYRWHFVSWCAKVVCVSLILAGNSGKPWYSISTITAVIKATVILYEAYDVLWSQRPSCGRKELSVHGNPWPDRDGPKSALWSADTGSASLKENLLAERDSA